MGIDLNDIGELKKVLNIKEINPKTKFWMVRTKKGFFYKEFISEEFIALGWNFITSEKIKNINDEDDLEILRNELKKLFPKIKNTTQIINKCIRFSEEIREGDIIMIPSNKKENEIAFAIAGKYYEEKECTHEKEIEAIDRIDSGLDYGIEVKCPYKKRRKIELLKVVDGNSLNVNLYKVLASYHGISDISSYGDFILSSIYNAYCWNNKLNMVFSVEQKTDIGAIPLSSFIYNSSKLFSLVEKDIQVTTKANLNSPGDLILSIQQYGSSILQLLQSKMFLLTIISLWFGVCGGKIGPVEFKSFAELIMKAREHKLKIRSDKLDIEKKEFELIKSKIEVAEKYIGEIKIAADSLEINTDAATKIINISDYLSEKGD